MKQQLSAAQRREADIDSELRMRILESGKRNLNILDNLEQTTEP